LSRRVISGLEEWLPPVLLQQRRVQKPAYSPAGPETSSRPACAQSKKPVRTLRTLAFFAALAPLCSTQSLSPNWEELTAEDFIHAVPQAQGSCAAFRHHGKARPFRTARHGPAKRALFSRTGGPTGSFGLRAVAPADKIAQCKSRGHRDHSCAKRSRDHHGHGFRSRRRGGCGCAGGNQQCGNRAVYRAANMCRRKLYDFRMRSVKASLATW